MVVWTLETLCEKLEVSYSGNKNLVLTQISGLTAPPPGSVCFTTNPTDLSYIGPSDPIAVIVPPTFKSDQHNLMFTSDPLMLHTQIAQYLHPPAKTSGDIHSTAILGKNVVLGNNVTLDAYVVLYDNVRIGDNSVLRAGVVVMENSTIGEQCMIYPNVTIRENCTIKNHVIVHSNSEIGSDGYGFFQRSGFHHKIPQVGSVLIEDDVEIGAGCTIDRARFDKTIIDTGTKLDNQVHVAHNVHIGKHSLLTAQVGIAGSVKTGSRLVMGGQSGIVDHVDIGDNVTILSRGLVIKNIKSNETIGGVPGRPANKWKHTQALIGRLDSLLKRVKRLEQERSSAKKQGDIQ